MKIIKDGKVYVQLNDIRYIVSDLENVSVPSSIIDSIFKDGKIFVCDDSNRFDFVEFSDEAAIKFFAGADYIVDYLALKDMSEEDLINEGEAIAEQKNNLAKKYNAMSDEDKKKNQKIVTKCENLVFKMLQIRDIVWIKQGKLDVKMPDNAGDGYKKETFVDKIKKVFKKR
jgi:hypothetical protein